MKKYLFERYRFIGNKIDEKETVKITINGERVLTASAGSSLLSTLGNEKIFLPSACGGGGTFKGLASDALEVVAETVAATLCRMYGYDGWQAVSSEYVARHTADGNGVRAALALLDHVDATLRIIFP